MLKREFERVLGKGSVAAARIATEAGTTRKRGFGYVDFWSLETGVEAVDKMHGQNMMGRNINVDDATRERGQSGKDAYFQK
jgi:RNA recognition motif-containing protein